MIDYTVRSQIASDLALYYGVADPNDNLEPGGIKMKTIHSAVYWTYSPNSPDETGDQLFALRGYQGNDDIIDGYADLDTDDKLEAEAVRMLDWMLHTDYFYFDATRLAEKIVTDDDYFVYGDIDEEIASVANQIENNDPDNCLAVVISSPLDATRAMRDLAISLKDKE